MSESILLQGNCLEVMKDLPDNSIDSIVTDPPYGLKFMGKKWDYSVPSKEIWIEALRVLKPGGHLLSFGGTRTYHRMVVNIEDAGFEIRDQIQWIYGSGFPKSHNIKEGEFKGWGTALKPANEPIVMARKPLEGTVAQNIEKWGVGGLNIEASRIGSEQIERGRAGRSSNGTGQHGIYSHGAKPVGFESATGRWPANVILDEQAAFVLDEQSGTLKTHGGGLGEYKGKGAFAGGRVDIRNQPKDSGGASRFFYVAKASKRERNAGLEGMPTTTVILGHGQAAVPKLTKAGKPNKPISNQNHHPTVKPVKLMEYLIKLVTPPNGVILDPFMGSGSTGVAAKKLDFKFIGIEMNEEYIAIAEKRIV